MRRSFFAVILLLTSEFAHAQQGIAGRRPEHSDTGGVLRQHSIASFGGSGQTSIQALATDSSGNVFVAGTTSAADFPVKNAAQPVLGEATILRTSDLGTTWTPVGSPPGVVSVLAPDPVAPQVLFAGANSSIFKSSDGGQTWRLVYTFQPNPPSTGVQFVGSLVIDSGNHLRLAASGTNGSLIRSLDGGETWTSGCPLLGCAGQLIADPSGSGALVLITSPLYLSRDWGLTFNPIGPPAGGNLSAAAMVPSHPGWIYADGGQGVFGSLSLSTDYGATWTGRANPPSNFSVIYGLAVDPDQPNVLVAATIDGLYKSTDSAASWTLQGRFIGAVGPGRQAPFALVSHQCNPAGGLYALVSGPGSFQVAFSPDDGVTFMTPQLSQVATVVAGPNCVAYAVRQPGQEGSDAFVAKLAPDGSTLWATFLGGSDQDTAVALAVDAQGNAYVAGNTVSPDFPVTVPRIGVEGTSSVFVTRYSPDGKITYSAVIGGEAANDAVAIAVDLSQNAHLLGYTNSLRFPVTPGALVSTLDSGSYTGFLLKLSPNATVIYATYLGESYTHPGAILVGADDQPIVAGNGAPPGLPPPPQDTSPDFVMKLDPTGSRVVQATYIQGSPSSGFGPNALGVDASGNLVVLGSTEGASFPTTPGAYASPNPSVCGAFEPDGTSVGGIYVTELGASDWNPIYSAFLCGGQSGAMAIDSTGAVILTAGAGSGFPLHNPLLAGPGCPYTSFASGAIARLSPDGSTLEFATYIIDTCGAPAIALAGDGSIYLGSGLPYGADSIARVLHLNATNPQTISLDQISNAFSGDSSAVVGGGLYALSVSGFQPPTADLGLNSSQDLPTQLGGVEVTFDGVPAAILRTSPGQVIVAPPWNLHGQANPPLETAAPAVFTSVQLSYNGVLSNAAAMPVSIQLPGLLPSNFPSSYVSNVENFPDGNVQNQDGVQNDVNHPAAVGSTITVFVTGMGIPDPTGDPGSIATSQTLASVVPVYSSWADYSGTDIFHYPPETVYSVPGFVSALFQIPIKAPNSLLHINGTDMGNGVQRVPFYLNPNPPVDSDFTPPSSVIGVYLK